MARQMLTSALERIDNSVKCNNLVLIKYNGEGVFYKDLYCGV